MQYSSILDNFNLYGTFDNGTEDEDSTESVTSDGALIFDPLEEILLACS